MIRIPNEVRFGGVAYKVHLVNELLAHPSNPKLVLMGACLRNKKQILLYNNEDCPSSVEETWLHEGIEGINAEYDLQLPHHAIKTLGVALHQMLAESKVDFSQSAVHGLIAEAPSSYLQ